MILFKILEAAKAAGRFVIERPRDALIILLLVLLAFLDWSLTREHQRSQEMAAKSGGLPSNTQQVVTIYRDRIVTKWRDGPMKIEYRDRYLPPEGHVEVVSKVDQPEKPPEVIIKDHGFTTRLGGGIIYAGEPLPLLDLKWAYWRRYSLTLGITPKFCGVGVSRHVDDLVPLHNLELLGLFGPTWQGQFRSGLGLRLNF